MLRVDRLQLTYHRQLGPTSARGAIRWLASAAPWFLASAAPWFLGEGARAYAGGQLT